METRLMERIPFRSPAEAQLTPLAPGLLVHRVQMATASLFLLSGILFTSIGIPNFLDTIQEGSVKITGSIDTEKLSFSEHIRFEVDRKGLYRNAIFSVSGIFAILLSTGFLCGMGCRRL